MGKIVNAAVRNTSGNGITKIGDKFAQRLASNSNYFIGKKQGLQRTVKANLTQSSETCPILSQCVDVKKGIELGDFTKAAIGGGLVASLGAQSAISRRCIIGKGLG